MSFFREIARQATTAAFWIQVAAVGVALAMIIFTATVVLA